MYLPKILISKNTSINFNDGSQKKIKNYKNEYLNKLSMIDVSEKANQSLFDKNTSDNNQNMIEEINQNNILNKRHTKNKTCDYNNINFKVFENNLINPLVVNDIIKTKDLGEQLWKIKSLIKNVNNI